MKIEVWLDSPAFLKKFNRVFLEGRELKIASARAHKGFLITKFEGVEDVNAAMTLKGKTIHILRADARLPIDDAGDPVAGRAGDRDGFAPVVFSQDRRRGRGTAAKTHIHRVYVLTAAAAGGHATVIILRDVQIGGGHEAALTVIVHRIPGAAGTIRHRYGVAPDEAVNHPVIGTGTGAEIHLAAGDNGGFRKSGDAEADAHKPGGKQGP